MIEPPRLTMPVVRFAVSGMYGSRTPAWIVKVIDALLGLLDQRVAIDLPRQVFGFAVHFFECLIDRHGPDRHGRIAKYPFACRVDVLAGREVHHRVGSPQRRPAHLFDLFVDGRSDRRVADVGVDLDQEIAADDHRLAFGMVDVRRDDRPAASDLVADEFGRDEFGIDGAERFAAVLMIQRRRSLRSDADKSVRVLPAAEIFADRDVLHLGRDDAFAGVVHLRHALARFCTKRCTSEAGKFFERFRGL